MIPFAEAPATPWTWRRPHLWSRRYELRAGDALLASLETRSVLSSVMVGETTHGQWLLRHAGLLRGRVQVLVPGTGAELAAFRPRWFGAGDVTTAAGQSLRWHRADFWGRRWELADAGGLARITFERMPAFLSPDTAVNVSEAARDDTELEPLVLLGFYLVLLMARQSHAV